MDKQAIATLACKQASNSNTCMQTFGISCDTNSKTTSRYACGQFSMCPLLLHARLDPLLTQILGSLVNASIACKLVASLVTQIPKLQDYWTCGHVTCNHCMQTCGISCDKFHNYMWIFEHVCFIACKFDMLPCVNLHADLCFSCFSMLSFPCHTAGNSDCA